MQPNVKTLAAWRKERGLSLNVFADQLGVAQSVTSHSLTGCTEPGDLSPPRLAMAKQWLDVGVIEAEVAQALGISRASLSSHLPE